MGGCGVGGEGVLAARRRSILKMIMGRRTIRLFREGEIPDDVLELIVEAGVRAPIYLQSYTVIQVRDRGKREELAKLCGVEAVEKAGAVLLVCSDLHRPKRLLDILGHPHILQVDKHPVEAIYSVFEAALMVENMILAAEALGLGSVILDCPLLEARRIAEMFNLPRGVTPLILLCIGERGEVPPLRPRLPLNMVFHRDEYVEPRDEELEGYLKTLEKHMESENYVRKYAGMDMRYTEYLKLKTELSEENKKISDSVAKFLKENLMKL